jgi:hypothetical protein
VKTTTDMTQAERVIRQFGGVQGLVEALKKIGRPRDRVVVYRWLHPREKRGTGGRIPAQAWDDIFLAAKAVGLNLSSELVDPRTSKEREDAATGFEALL